MLFWVNKLFCDVEIDLKSIVEDWGFCGAGVLELVSPLLIVEFKFSLLLLLLKILLVWIWFKNWFWGCASVWEGLAYGWTVVVFVTFVGRDGIVVIGFNLFDVF